MPGQVLTRIAEESRVVSFLSEASDLISWNAYQASTDIDRLEFFALYHPVHGARVNAQKRGSLLDQ
jgi:hypothetical protein